MNEVAVALMFPPKTPSAFCTGGVDESADDGVCSLLITFLSSSKKPACSGGLACAPLITKNAASATKSSGPSRKRFLRLLPFGPKTRVLIDALPLSCDNKAGRPPSATPGETSL